MSSTTDTEQRFAYLLSPEFEIVNTAGKPLTGGWIEVYIHGTRDKYYCLSDFDGTLHPFQIPLDSLGSNIVLASPTHAYDIYIYNKFGSLVMSRYNVVPATNSPDAVADVVVIDSPDETINVTIDGGSNWHLEVNTDLIATASGLAEVSGALTEVSGALLNKKDKQEALSFEGAATKTVKNISQDDNGVITVEYEDIDLPQQVPNVNIISPSGTLDITSTTDPATNTKTFKIDVHKSNMDYFEGYYGRAHYEDRPSDTVAAFTTYVDQWREYRYQGDFIANSWQDQDNTTFLLNSGLYLITASIRYKMTDASVKNKEEYIRIATGAFNGLENGTQLKDWSNEAALDENTIQLSFVRSVDDDEDYDNLRGNHTLYFAPYLPYGVNYAEIDHLQIVKLDSIVTYHGGPGPSYSPGYGIEIQDNVISIATGDVVTNNYFETVVSSINTEINELTTVINNVSGDITNLNESVTNLIGATGDYATKDYVDEAVSGLENYSAGQYISIEDHVINVTGVQPEGDYATNADLQAVSAAIPESEEVEFEELDLAQFAQASAVTVIQNQITNVTGDIYNINEDITNLIGATGDYATEEYVNEAIAAVTGVPFEQQQSDWTQTDDTKVDYIKHKPRQVNLVAGDNITIEQDGFDVIISAEDPGDTYTAGQYISIQNNTIAATGLQPAGNYLTPADLNGYATEQYVDDAVAAVTGQPITQVNSDWLATSGVAEILNKPDVFQLIAGDNIDITPSGNDLVISASSDVTKAYVDEQIDAATGMIPDISNLATKAELEDVIDMIPDVSNFATNDDVQYVQEQVDQLVAATGYYLQASDLNGYATEQDVDAAIDAATGMIPDVSNLATKSELAAVEAEIPTLPSEEEVEFEELNLSDYALASAIPDISNLATKTELQEVDVKVDAVSGKLPTTEEGQFTIHPNTEGADVTVIYPTDVAPVSGFYDLNDNYDDDISNRTGPSTYYYVFRSPGYDNDTWSANDGDVIQIKVNEAIQGVGSIHGFYSSNNNPAGANGPTINYPSSNPLVSGTGAQFTIAPGVYTVALGSNPAGSSYGKYICLMVSKASAGTYVDDILDKIEFTFGRPNAELGATVNLSRYYLSNPVNSSTLNSELACQLNVDSVTKQQKVYIPGTMPNSWTSRIAQYVAYDSNRFSPGGYGTSQQYIAYKATSNPSRYQYAFCTDHDLTNRKMTFISYNESGEAIEKWIVDYSTYSSNVWTTTPIETGSTYTAGSGIDITNDTISIDNTVALKSDIPDVTTLATKTELNAVDAKVDAVSAEIPTLPEEEEVQFEEVNLSDYALASAIPSLDGYATEQYVDEQIAAVTGIIPSDVVTEQELADAIDAATGLIPDVSNLATKSELEDYIPYAASGVDLPNSKFGITPDGQAYKTIQHNVKRDVVYLQGDMLLQTDIEGTYYPAGTYEIHVPVGATYAYVVLDQETYILDVNNGVALWTVSTPFTTAGVDYVIVALDSDTNTIALTADNSALYLAGQDSIVNYLTETDLIAGANVTITDVGSGIMISASGGGAEDDEFYAIYGVTTLAEVNAAAAAGKKLFAKSGDMILLCDNRSSTYATFIAVDYNAGPEIITATVTSSGWAISTDSLQANWAETDTSKASYIYNKPAIPNYTAGSGIDITNDVISVDDTVITTEASGVYLPNSNFEIAPDGRAAIVKGGAGSTDYTPAWVDGTYNVLTFAEPITLLAGDTISFNHSKYPYVFIRINGITVVNEYIPGSQYTYTVESDTQVSEISIAASDDDPRFIRLNTVTITSSAVQRDVYVLKSELASAVEHIESEIVTPVQSDWNVTASGNLAYIKNKPGNERFVPEASFEIIGQVLTVGNGGIPFWAQPQGSYSAGKGITLANNAISVDDTVITTAATAVNLSKANFEIDNNGQAYKLSNNSTQVTYAITQASNGGTFDGTIKLNAGDTITITNCPVTDEQLDVRLMSNNTNVAGYNGAVTAGSNIVLTVTRDTDLTDTFKVQVFSFTSFDNVPLTNSSCTFNNIVTSREEYALEAELNSAVSGLATKTEVGNKQDTLTGITDVQVVQSLPAEPVATVLYLIPEA